MIASLIIYKTKLVPYFENLYLKKKDCRLNVDTKCTKSRQIWPFFGFCSASGFCTSCIKMPTSPEIRESMCLFGLRYVSFETKYGLTKIKTVSTKPNKYKH